MLARAILVLLIVLNVGAALWWIAHDSAPTAIEAVPPPGVARLQLVSERQAAPAPEPVAAPAPVATATVAGAAQCFSLGPFATRAAAETALARVQSLVQRAAVRTPVTQASGRGWRVFLPAFATLEEADAAAARITAAGFDDLMVVREGAEARSVALGRYRNEDGARNRAQALAGAAQQRELDCAAVR